MSHGFFTVVVAFIFTAKGLFCGLAAYYGWEIIVNGMTVPATLLWAGSGLAFVLAYSALCLTR